MSSFEQTMMEWSPRCYIQSHRNRSMVPEKIFEGFLPYMDGHCGHLGHVTSIILIDFYFHVPKSLHTKVG